jgi:hypothetical protein
MILLSIFHMKGAPDRASVGISAPAIAASQPPGAAGHHNTKITDYRFAWCASRVESIGGKIFHFSICHLAHVRVICDCF